MTTRIDCDTCVVRGLHCHDCVVTVLLGPPPELTIDDDERDRPDRGLAQDVARVGSRIQQHRRPLGIGECTRERSAIGPVDTDVQLGIRQAQARHARRADRHVALTPVLQDHDPRGGLEAREQRAVAHHRWLAAAQAARARLVPSFVRYHVFGAG